MKRHGMKQWMLGVGLLTGMLVGASAAGALDGAPPQSQSDSGLATLAVAATERSILLGDGSVLRLDAEGTTLTLSNSRNTLRSWSLPTPRLGASMTLLPSGRVLVWGGMDQRRRALQPSGLWFDPAVQFLSDASIPKLAPRMGHTATVLTDGRVLFVGGRSAGPRAELWDERSGLVSPLSMDAALARLGQTAQLQADGRVRLTGGMDALGRPASSDVLFDTPTLTFQRAPRAVQAAGTNVALAASLPASGAQDVNPTARLALRFTQPLRMSDVNASSVTLLGPGGATRLRVVSAEGGKLLFATPAQDLFPDSKYTLLISGINAASGKPLQLTAIDFRTRSLASGESDGTGNTPTPAVKSVDGLPPTPCAQTGHWFSLCRKQGVLADGVWIPGTDNTRNRWRVPGAQPELVDPTLAAWTTAALRITTVMGRVLRVDGVPVANVDVSIGNTSVRTNANGDFMLFGPVTGHQELYVDGSTANANGAEYGQFVVGVDVKAAQLTQLPYTMYLPRITARDKVQIPSPLTHDMVVTQPDMPGLELHIPAGTVIHDRKGRLVTELAIVPTPVNRTPFPVMENHPIAFTIEPGGAQIRGLDAQASGGIRVYYPNYDHYKPGTQSNFWIYDPTDGWRVYGMGTVGADGRQIVPEPGVALHETMGGMHTTNNDDPGTEHKPNCDAGCSSGGATSGKLGATAGDPIDLFTGTFQYDETDIAIRDIMPLTLERSYRPNDLKVREFGIATASNFSYHLNGPGEHEPTIDLVLPNGTTVPFTQVAQIGTDDNDWIQPGSPTGFNGALLQAMTSGDGLGGPGESFLLTLRDGTQMNFGASGPSHLQWIRDQFGNRIDIAYDAGLMSKVASTSGRYIKFVYDAGNRIHTATDNAGHTWTYDYDNDGMLRQVTYPDTTTKKYAYVVQYSLFDPTLMLTQKVKSITDQRGMRSVYNEFETISGPGFPSYETLRVIKQTMADGSFYAINYAHDNGTNIGVLITQPDNSQRRVVYSTNGDFYPVSETLGYGTSFAQTYLFERDPGSDLLTARTDSLNRRTEYQYDGNGRTTQVTYLAGTSQAISVSASYNSDGDLATITDPLNHTTTLGYTNRCLTSVTNPIGKITTIICNSAGQPTSVTDALHHTTLLQYLGFDLASVTDPLNRTVTMRYDPLGRPIAVQDAQGNISRREYDINGRISKTVDAAGNATNYLYDPNGNLTTVQEPPGNGITYHYDSRNHLLDRTDSLNQIEHWTYDAMDRVHTSTDRNNQITTIDRDVLGRPTVVHEPDTSTKTFAYADGVHLSSLTDSAAGMLSWTYDDFDRIKSESGAQGIVGYGYDASGRRTSLNPGTQTPVAYQYDDANRLQSITQGSEVVGFQYDDANRLLQTTLPNNVKAGYAYNTANQLTGIAWLKPDNSALGDLGYGYNSIGRLVAHTGSFASQTLPAASTGANTFDDNHRQTQYNGQTLSYDANGNLTFDGSKTYVWSTRNQLTQIKQGTTVTASFAYDALGRRISKTEGGITTSFLYDGANAVQEKQGTTINPILTGLGIDERFARNEGSTRSYFLTDALGSTVALANAGGTLIQKYQYDPYGNATGTAVTTNPYLYTGRESDGTGLYYYRARYYSPGMGRFISEDPMGFGGGQLNFYAYVAGNPLSYRDPHGLAMSPARECGGGPGSYAWAHCGDPPPPPSSACPDTSGSSRNNNPNLNRNILLGAGAGGIITAIFINIVGFPEAELSEAGAAALWGTGGANLVAGMDAVAGEPFISSAIITTSAAAPGVVVGGTAGYVATPPTPPPPGHH